jgi:hypothetical protein
MEAPMMRIVLILAAAAGAAAMNAPAAAQSGAMIPQARAGGGHGAFFGGRPGRDRDDRFRRHRFRHHDRFDRGAQPFLYPFGWAEDFEDVDPHGAGFFSGGGGAIRMEGGRPHYDYDRGYPYEWASAADRSRGAIRAQDGGGSIGSCRLERGVRVCRGGR